MFQTSVFRKYIRGIEQAAVDAAWTKFKETFLNEEKQRNIRNSHEIQYQEGFCRDLFCHVLGYTINPEPGFNLKTEQKNQNVTAKTDHRSVDAAVILNGNVRVIIELKGCDTLDLSKVEPQAFGYKAHQPGCRYVVISNFERLRFYIDTADKYLEFNLFHLTYEEFTKLYLCLALTQIENDVPGRIKADSLTSESEITANFYKDYSVFKRSLFHNIVEHNADRFDKLLLFRKTQKLLDRLIFIFFCEDRGLLTANTIAKIIQRWQMFKDNDGYQPLYKLFKRHFVYIDQGHQDKEMTVFGYNGGLFRPDEDLDSFVIDDDILLGAQKLSNYDFESDVSVDILGHIFEHSLTEIEEVQNQIMSEETSQALKTNETKKTSKRKKDGVFYTPAYITKYIVENTIGHLCEEKKKELGIDSETYAERNQKNTAKEKNIKKQLADTLDVYRQWLLGLKICDPACGSGAFLNAALQFLQNEHSLIDRYKAHIYGHTLILSDVVSTILENNLYGVDINDEAVEIAKLSLWLHTARPGRKLTTLNNNIKCGNSLIDDPDIAGDKAFNWQNEFPEVFANGGFDVVIGNPPYLRVQGLKENFEKESAFYEQHYMSATERFDYYVLFMEKAFGLIHKTGIQSFILPHKFINSSFGIGIRKFIYQNRALNKLIHFGNNQVFKDASVYTCIIVLSNENNIFDYSKIMPEKISQPFKSQNLSIDSISDCSPWVILDNTHTAILNRLNNFPLKVKDVFKGIYQGIVSGDNKSFYLSDCVIDEAFVTGFSQITQTRVRIERDLCKKIYTGKSISKYLLNDKKEYIIYPYHLVDGKTVWYTEEEMNDKFPLCMSYFYSIQERLENRGSESMKYPIWYALWNQRNIQILESFKILTPDICYGSSMTLDKSGVWHNDTSYALVLNNPDENLYKSYLAILNSKITWYFLQVTGTELRGGYFRFKTKYLEPFPLPDLDVQNIKLLSALADAQLLAHAQLQKHVSKFLNRAKNNLGLTKISEKLESFYQLEFKDFMAELKKQKIKLSLRDQDEWEEYFNSFRQNCTRLLLEIEENNRKIDQLIYGLYGLTEEEIAVIERGY